MSNILKMLARGGAVEPTDENFNQTVLLLHGDGTNGAQNNTFLDSSTNNFTITRNGNTTQGSFSPFSAEDGKWSNYFDGNGDYLSVANDAALEFGTGDFTIEFWVNRQGLGTPVGGATVDSIISKKATNTFTAAQFTVDINRTSLIYEFRNSSGVLVSSTSTSPVGTFTHIAIVRSGTTLSLFFNGTREGTATNSTNFNDTNPLQICLRQGNVRSGLNGYLSNLLIAKSAKYDSTQTTITVPTAPLTTVSNTGLLTCQSNRFVDNSSNAFAVTVNGNTSVQPFSPFAPSAAYDPSVNGGSGYFDGTGDYLTAPDDTNLDFGTGDFTVEFFAYFTTLGSAYRRIVTSTIGALGANDLVVRVHNTNVIQVYVGATNFTCSTTLATNQWYHIALVRIGEDCTLYLNGVSDGTGTSSADITNAVRYVGGQYNNSSEFFVGYLNGVRLIKGTALYTTTFTPPTAPLTAVSGTELLLNFTNAGIFDNTGKNNLETVGNAQIDTSVVKYGTGSMEFDGTGDYLKGVGSNPNLNFGSGDFTIEFWMYTADVTPSVAAYLVAVFNSNSGQNSWGVRLETTGAIAVLLSSNGGESPTNISAASPALSNDTWHHISVVRNGSGSNNITIYVDGVSKATGTFSSALFNSNQPVTVGIQGNTSFNQYFNGLIDDLRISRVARYTTGFTPPTAAFPDL